MARGGTRGPPYEAVVQLWIWATARHAYVDGRLLLAGLDAGTLPARRLLNVVFVLMSEQIADVNRDEILERLETDLAKSPVPDRESWGTSPSFVQGQRSIMAEFGPPPGWAEKIKKDG